VPTSPVGPTRRRAGDRCGLLITDALGDCCVNPWEVSRPEFLFPYSLMTLIHGCFLVLSAEGQKRSATSKSRTVPSATSIAALRVAEICRFQITMTKSKVMVSRHRDHPNGLDHRLGQVATDKIPWRGSRLERDRAAVECLPEVPSRRTRTSVEIGPETRRAMPKQQAYQVVASRCRCAQDVSARGGCRENVKT
jgi:hypothetical protein